MYTESTMLKSLLMAVNESTIIDNEPKQEDANIAKAVAMLCLFMASFTLGSLPVKLGKWLNWDNDAKNNSFVKLLLGAGGGVLLCTTFIHLLPEVAEGITGLNIITDHQMHYAELLMCVGFFTMYFVEEIIHHWLHKKEELNTVRRSLMIRRGELDEIEKIQQIAVLESGVKPRDHLHDHSHNHNHEHSHVVSIDAESTINAIRGLLVVLALSIHELFEGMAVGLESSSGTVWYMFGAVSAHKLVIAFCIGVELVSSSMKTSLVLIYVFTFAIVSPLGIGIGIIISNTGENSTDVSSVILQGLASGTLLYVVFFEILQSDRKRGMKQFFSVFSGFLVMTIITILA